jgi:putative aldouronate transport system substrate-binding protein
VEKQFTGPYGVLDGFYLNEQGKVAYSKTQPGFKDYLTLMNKWYSEGLINKDFAGLKGPQINALFDSGKAAMIVSSVDGTYSRGEPLGNSYVPAPFPRLKTPTDKIHYQPAQEKRGGNVTVVTTTSKHKIEAIRWLNYAYTKEGSMLMNYGIEGKTYNMVNGVPQYTDYMLHNPKFPTSSANYILKVHFAPKIQCRDVDCNPNILISPKGKTMRLKWSDDPNVDSDMYLPPISLTPDEAAKRGKIMTDVDTYADEMVLKFILGAEPLSNFDNFVAQLKKFGVDEAVQITQAAYDRFQNKK